nr:O-antigen ligase family protein [Ktedonobacteraceae bacterium]
MITAKIWSRAIAKNGRIWRTFFTPSYIFIIAIIALVTALPMGGVVIAALLGGTFGHLGLYAVGGIIVALFMAIAIILRQDELAAVFIIVVHVYVDFYIGLAFVAQIMALAVLVIFFLARSPRYAWTKPRALWIWALFLGLCILPSIQGATDFSDAALYYPNIILGALIMFWLGTVSARDNASLRRLWKIFAVFGTLIAIHSIIQEVTGKVLFSTAFHDAFLASVSNYQLGQTDAHRVGSFFTDPDYNGVFLSMMLFIQLGLLVESSSLLEKTFYLAETFLMLLALLFTYSGGAWIGSLAGFLVYLVLIGRARYRILLSLCILAAVLVLVVFFPSQVNLLFQHAAGSNELPLRVGIWQTAIRVIIAFPLTGVGLSHIIYQQRAEPYRVPAQTFPIDHPHNSYLEFGAMAGLPVLLVFVALLLHVLWQAFSQWRRADVQTRSLVAAGIAAVIALSISSIATNGWTLPPLAAIGWLILGAISSPLLSRALSRTITNRKIT